MRLSPGRLSSAGEVAGGRARPGRTEPAPAFTLIEILITLSLLVLLAGIAWPMLETQIKASELPESAQRVRTMLNMARCEAVMENRRFRIRFEPEQPQPLIEWEVDPVEQPGVWTPSPAGWAQEPMLLADVQVHHVTMGRPVYMRPLAETEDPQTVREEMEQAEELRRERETQEPVFGQSKDSEEDLDENRHTIVFEADGSTEWATLVLARILPEEDLPEEEPQSWVILDGRTGLAFIRDQISEDQLSDPEFYVKREKLELPDTMDVDDLTFDIASLPMGEFGAELGGGTGDLGAEMTGEEAAGMMPEGGLPELPDAAAGEQPELPDAFQPETGDEGEQGQAEEDPDVQPKAGDQGDQAGEQDEEEDEQKPPQNQPRGTRRSGFRKR